MICNYHWSNNIINNSHNSTILNISRFTSNSSTPSNNFNNNYTINSCSSRPGALIQEYSGRWRRSGQQR